jgi:hypothetical protein
MNLHSEVSLQARSRPVAAIALLIVFMAIATLSWRMLPRPESLWVPWIPVFAALFASRVGDPATVLSVRSIAYAGSAFLICQVTIQLLLAAGVIAI